MKRYTGVVSTLALSYDLVFLALLYADAGEEGFKLCPGKCSLHPFKRRPIAGENSALKYSAGAASILTYYKLLDDLNDKNKKHRFAIKIALWQAKRQIKRVYKKLPEYNFPSLSERISVILGELTELEGSFSDSPDRCADVFGRLLSELFAYGIKDKEKAECAGTVGYALGRMIYLIDAADDFYDDLKTKAFNPLVTAGFSEIPEDFLCASLYCETERAKEALKSFGFKYTDIENILTNILTLGMPSVADKIIKEKQQKAAEKG
jgi:hypothetical protein